MYSDFVVYLNVVYLIGCGCGICNIICLIYCYFCCVLFLRVVGNNCLNYFFI